MNTVERMRQVLDSVFEGEIDSSAIKETDNLKSDLEMNSIAMLYMVMGLEEEFEIKFENSDFANMETVADVIRAIEAKL
ncbi:MAG: acyl carrier protein [Clostridia bacterium]|nr:acyl carrier protein [Clostridia bacterium]